MLSAGFDEWISRVVFTFFRGGRAIFSVSFPFDFFGGMKASSSTESELSSMTSGSTIVEFCAGGDELAACWAGVVFA